VLPKDELASKIARLGSQEKGGYRVCRATGWGEDGCILWMLKIAGVKDAKMLDGGYAAWEKAKMKSARRQ
jgi:thiosulfate/3-mercaptopyruvate sulfurtransferase